MRLQLKWPGSKDKTPEEIVLPYDIQKRINVIVKVASAASARRFPLRSVLIHGKPGCGKSMIAKSIAQSIQILPYAMMSGSDGELLVLVEC